MFFIFFMEGCMRKKIIVLAIVSAISAPALADTANVTVYGAVDMAFSNVSSGNTVAANAAGAAVGCTLGTPCSGTTTNHVSSQVSKLGFKGSEDVGDGLSAIWQIEQQIDVDNSSAAGAKNTFATRNSFVGMKSDSVGTVLMGRHDTPYKIATRKLDVFVDQIATNLSLIGGGTSATATGYHDMRPTDTVVYISPSMSGFTVAASYIAGAETASAATDVKGSAWSLAGMYDVGPLYAALAYQTLDFGSPGTGQLAGTANTKATAWKAGIGYKLEALQVNAVYEKTSDSLTAVTGADKFGRSAYSLAGKYIFGNDDVKLEYTHAGKQAGAAAGTDTSAKQISVGYDHNLSKRTTVYAQYTKLTNGTDAAYSITKAGSTAGGFALLGNGASPSAWSLGMKHTF